MATSGAKSVTELLEELKLQLETFNENDFERLAADLFCRLLGDVGVSVSKPGAQFGGDAGTSGLRRRHLRLECKRYKETTPLNPRGLAGEVVEAILKDPQLEAWVLASTKTVSENERNLALEGGLEVGVPVVVIDWTPPPAGVGINRLAALCAEWPKVVEQHVGKAAADLAIALAPHAGRTVAELRKDLETWNIGFNHLRDKTLEHIKRIWSSSTESKATLNQDAAGGQAGVKLVQRKAVLDALSTWWLSPAASSPAMAVGQEGVGKTWAAFDWVNQNLPVLPIVLPVPASTFSSHQDLGETGLRDLLARSLRSAAKSRHPLDYWRARVERLLERPLIEGVAVLLVVDGLNQHPSVRWQDLGQTLQAEALAGKVRMLCTVRQHCFDTTVRKFSALDVPPTVVPVGSYSPDELEDLLAKNGMNKSDIPAALLDLATYPRLFQLIVRLKDKDALRSDATVLRLLYEYGKDVHQIRTGEFADEAWVGWLSSRAKEFLDRLTSTGAKELRTTIPELTSTLDTGDVSSDVVARRLSEVVDSRLFRHEKSFTGSTKLVLEEQPTILSLGIALLETLPADESTFEEVQSEALKWLEPVAAIDKVSDVLRAALAILSATGSPDASGATDALLALWLNAQNPSAEIERDAFAFGEAFPRSMLTVVEVSTLDSRTAAFHYAVQSLRRLPRSRFEDWDFIVKRMLQWAGRMELPAPEKVQDPNHYAKRHQEQILERIGVAQPGVVRVYGEELQLAYSHPGDPSTAIPGILEGHDLTAFLPVIRRAAVRQAVRADYDTASWEGFRLLLLLACQNPEKARADIAAMAEGVLTSASEPGVNPRLRNRIAAYLLRLTGVQEHEERAAQVDERFSSGWDYQKDYLDNPAESHFELEYRHRQLVLTDSTIPADARLQRLSAFLAIPELTLPADLTAVIEDASKAVTFQQVGTMMGTTAEEHALERLVLLGARYAPERLAELSRRCLSTMASRTKGEQKYWSALTALEFLMVSDEKTSAEFTKLRTASVHPDRDELANTWCLQLELLHLPLQEQLKLLLDAQNYSLDNDLVAEIRPATTSELRSFLQANTQHGEKAARIVMHVMARQVPSDADELAQDLLGYLHSETANVRGIAHVALALTAPQVMGRALMSKNWKADPVDVWAAHYGSFAVASVTKHLPLEDVLGIIAPWRWLDAVVMRGSDHAELEIASHKMARILDAPAEKLPEVEGVLAVRMPKQSEMAQVLVTEPDGPRGDIKEFIRRTSRSAEEVNRRMEQLALDAAATIEKIRRSGHTLYLHTFDVEKVGVAYQATPSAWDELLEGADIQSLAFRRRMHLAGGVLLCLAEVLFTHAPDKGLKLWRGLLGSSVLQFGGPAKISELVHIVMRAPDSPAVLAAREDLASLAHCNTDKHILELVIAAQLHGRQKWLKKLIADDEASVHLWRRKRAIVLRGFFDCPPVNQLRWPEGQPIGSTKALERKMLSWTNRGSLAKYWWNRFMTATDAAHAFAAWHVFLSCADRRAWLWRAGAVRPATEVGRLGALHLRANKNHFVSRLDKEEGSSKLAEHFLGLDTPSKWLMLDGVASRS